MKMSSLIKLLWLPVALWPIEIVALTPNPHSEGFAEHFFRLGFLTAMVASSFVSAFGLFGGTARITARKAICVSLLAVVFIVINMWLIMMMTFRF